jgi:hypothetical protein
MREEMDKIREIERQFKEQGYDFVFGRADAKGFGIRIEKDDEVIFRNTANSIAEVFQKINAFCMKNGIELTNKHKPEPKKFYESDYAPTERDEWMHMFDSYEMIDEDGNAYLVEGWTDEMVMSYLNKVSGEFEIARLAKRKDWEDDLAMRVQIANGTMPIPKKKGVMPRIFEAFDHASKKRKYFELEKQVLIARKEAQGRGLNFDKT